jgi:hypothetical protein
MASIAFLVGFATILYGKHVNPAAGYPAKSNTPIPNPEAVRPGKFPLQCLNIAFSGFGVAG